uniref:U6 snRNA-associated Sm-like protein LSm4 n=14 Tax=Aves TaxID=8782 RepID=U3K4C8_FICAL
MVSTGRAALPRAPHRYRVVTPGTSRYRVGDTGHVPVPALCRRPVTAVVSQLVELKNGETYNGHLVSCDNWMNINLREVICTSRDGDKFWRMPECYIRGSTIKYLRIPDEIIDMVKEEVVSKGRGRGGMQQQKQQKGRGVGGAGRGVFGGRGRGIPGSGRGQQEKKPGRQSAKQ